MANVSAARALRITHVRLLTSVAMADVEQRALVRPGANVRWWPAALAFILLGVAYALVSERLTVGPRWAMLALVVVAVLGVSVLRWRGMFHATRVLALGVSAVGTCARTGSAARLVETAVAQRHDA